MFENAPEEPGSIAVETSEGREVTNQVEPEPDDGSRMFWNSELNNHHSWHCRKPPCGIYNCAGHVWASRRTGIHEWNEIEKILSDDDYRQVALKDCRVGDLALYHREELRDWLHVALIIDIREGPGDSVAPLLLSKFDASSGEYIHSKSDVPFRKGADEYRITYFTERGV